MHQYRGANDEGLFFHSISCRLCSLYPRSLALLSLISTLLSVYLCVGVCWCVLMRVGMCRRVVVDLVWSCSSLFLACSRFLCGVYPRHTSWSTALSMGGIISESTTISTTVETEESDATPMYQKFNRLLHGSRSQSAAQLFTISFLKVYHLCASVSLPRFG
jgi:hypothetical protein